MLALEEFTDFPLTEDLLEMWLPRLTGRLATAHMAGLLVVPDSLPVWPDLGSAT